VQETRDSRGRKVGKRLLTAFVQGSYLHWKEVTSSAHDSDLGYVVETTCISGAFLYYRTGLEYGWVSSTRESKKLSAFFFQFIYT
jgi:hypothetical protein